MDLLSFAAETGSIDEWIDPRRCRWRLRPRLSGLRLGASAEDRKAEVLG